MNKDIINSLQKLNINNSKILNDNVITKFSKYNELNNINHQNELIKKYRKQLTKKSAVESSKHLLNNLHMYPYKSSQPPYFKNNNKNYTYSKIIPKILNEEPQYGIHICGFVNKETNQFQQVKCVNDNLNPIPFDNRININNPFICENKKSVKLIISKYYKTQNTLEYPENKVWKKIICTNDLIEKDNKNKKILTYEPKSDNMICGFINNKNEFERLKCINTRHFLPNLLIPINEKFPFTCKVNIDNKIIYNEGKLIKSTKYDTNNKIYNEKNQVWKIQKCKEINNNYNL